MDILEHIQELYPNLTKKQKSIADYLTANPEEISYITLAQLSQQTQVSELTLLQLLPKTWLFYLCRPKRTVSRLYPENDSYCFLLFLLYSGTGGR